MRILQYITILLLTQSLLGCAGLAPASKTKNMVERDGVSTLLIPSEYRDVYFIPKGSIERHCRAPGPDFSVEASDGVSLGVGSPIPGADKGNIGFDSSQGALSLGGRSADVLLTRELMYRACELTSNINSNNKESKEIYYRFLQTIERLGKAQIEIGTASMSDNKSTLSGPNFPTSASDGSDGMDDSSGG